MAAGWCVMKMRPIFAGIGLLMLATSCAPIPRVAVTASPADLERLTGKWMGEYESAALGRRGSIEFELRAGTNDARGDVLMVPRGGMPYQARPYHDAQPVPMTPSFEMLTIRFIRASNGSIVGRLDRYWDPDRNCFANTAFNGSVHQRVVEGTFTTTFECGAGEATGTWNVSKKLAKPDEARR
jgi:hypothetical protein